MNKVTRIKNNNYTTISNVFLRDKTLSLKAKGLLATILSLPENWDFSIKGICSVVKEGSTAIYSAIDELKERGYCSVEINRNEKGMIVGVDYTFYENPNTENPHVENLDVDNQSQRSDDNISNNINITNKTNKEEIKELKEMSDSLFEECWIAYRRKGKKGKAKPYWDKLSEQEKNNVMPHIKAYVQSRELQYQQDFERYLRDKAFQSVVFKNNIIIFDPTRFESSSYTPQGRTIWFNESTQSYWSDDNFYYGTISDGYTDDNRPDGAMLTLNNARGDIKWNSNTKKWENK